MYDFAKGAAKEAGFTPPSGSLAERAGSAVVSAAKRRISKPPVQNSAEADPGMVETDYAWEESKHPRGDGGMFATKGDKKPSPRTTTDEKAYLRSLGATVTEADPRGKRVLSKAQKEFRKQNLKSRKGADVTNDIIAGGGAAAVMAALMSGPDSTYKADLIRMGIAAAIGTVLRNRLKKKERSGRDSLYLKGYDTVSDLGQLPET
jgi:hypothetical protein